MDTLTRTERSKRMALIRSIDTKPELLVRRMASTCGHKFRLHTSPTFQENPISYLIGHSNSSALRARTMGSVAALLR